MLKQFPTFLLFAVLSIALSLCVPGQSNADPDREIQHLMTYIENSECAFIRNDKVYDAGRAREHIQKKFKATKRWVKTTEDFIEFTATKSSMSGKPYKVQCAGQELLCADWLKTELARFRQNK
jgi:Family of unknown function (DUF5329)